MHMLVEEAEDGVTRVRLIGELDDDGADRIRRDFAATAVARRKLVVDLSEVASLSASGVRCLLSGARAVYRRRGRMLLLAPRDPVRQVLYSFAIDAVLPIVDTWEGTLVWMSLSARPPSCGPRPSRPAAARPASRRLPSPV